MNDDYRTLRPLDDAARRAWLRERFPQGMSGHWWNTMVELAEQHSARPPITSEPERLQQLRFACSLLDLGVEQGLHPVFAVQWAARLAQRELRYGTNAATLPETLTPDGVAHLALSLLAVPYAEAEALTERGKALLATLAEDASPGERGMLLDSQPDEDLDKAARIDHMISPLEPLAAHIRDAGLSAEVRRWLDVLRYLN
ncbi:hypothetical protein HD597_009887 [Nonomuraea thailandensis]|uniref:Uncharacterized protein n=1 Tax=Nonomuraea thailandensis TaxID=1188745 RepID=A0A9X2GSA8_9ACTN|nr:hypothetical protein [Nonomuraea thailandensis]MCP2362867.1 hypothetical protein [Nonomuraea thailandensis]